MSAIECQINGILIVCSTVCSGADQRKHQSSASLAFVGGIHQWPVDSPHKGPVIWNMFPFDDVMTHLRSRLPLLPIPQVSCPPRDPRVLLWHPLSWRQPPGIRLLSTYWPAMELNFDGLEQEWCNSLANALELLLSYTNPLICGHK